MFPPKYVWHSALISAFSYINIVSVERITHSAEQIKLYLTFHLTNGKRPEQPIKGLVLAGII